ncbi:raffinose/stachyose/melibiose transport system permease protein [Pseudobutyrivibrio sp. NOR37]|jgi:raffinose/stachyose/melibiose transport system permease protein|uniref:Sugar ABC transporter permease n=3 Tax=Pseudobutyrivibrio TaxID=46205 RepID=A0A2G3DUN6_9FIRM|nr:MULTISPECIES: sugar ABC transporter permease [Pseudobutyrivibrio]NEX00797.1 sugar ABC transporter permease [Pseudobutyrivibrio xylanivorans]PHU34739.1 sugar ABC transporter permease [Pseudobutyrivibrio ruminis]PHU39816.1 sugar ABC transporter permease [Pseudobutyrivibrio ruminis]SCX81638.1 raffinose/stachyose/melibiose transport system permease protein [Pseudobutyrivibrio sp. AR14]SFR62763.1 raffinose/stachyose/melibiose transport system permease protein [Pseudobutyrivibrio sp. NOR37]
MDKLLRNKKAIIVFMAPGLLLFTLILFVPICQSIYYSLCEYKATSITGPKFIGLKNYADLLKDDTFWIALKNSFFFLVFSCVTQLIMGLFLAGLLTNIDKGRNLFKNIIYLPCVLSSAALGLLWMFIFSPKFGINKLIETLGVQDFVKNGPLWLMDTKGFIVLPMWVIAFVALWQYVGQSMMLYMAQISGISKSLYEASYIDGCSKAKSFRYITLPLIRPMVATAMSLNAIGSLKFFDLVFNMTEGGPNHRTEVLATHLYQQGFKYSKYGYASAIGVVLLILCLLVTAFINKVVKTEQYEM